MYWLGGFGSELCADSEVAWLDEKVGAEKLAKWGNARGYEKRAGAEGRACSQGEQECTEQTGRGFRKAGRLGSTIGGASGS